MAEISLKIYKSAYPARRDERFDGMHRTMIALFAAQIGVIVSLL